MSLLFTNQFVPQWIKLNDLQNSLILSRLDSGLPSCFITGAAALLRGPEERRWRRVLFLNYFQNYTGETWTLLCGSVSRLSKKILSTSLI